MGYSFGGNSSRFESKTRHTKEDALSDKEFELLYEGASKIEDDYYRLYCQFVVLVLGRLGLRRTELAHMKGDWVDWDNKLIHIPRHEDCECGDCKQKAQQKEDHNNGVSYEEALNLRWHPKTETAIREVPFGFNARIELIIERFFERFDDYPHSANSVNRRIDRAVENSKGIKNTYPHALRATAASYHAGRGLGVLPLQSMFGWANLSTPLLYVKQSGKNTARELRNVHSR